uniref:MADS-box domain-containing protein n=1 Tax=Setaria viridis TaxID=4556 RepID=A0A4U6V7U2_SETVI|nr:hypothetical protein SEVIR_3G056000v2 [Setaria viridis]
MPRRGGKIKIQWIAEKAVRQAAFRKRHTTLFDKARDLSILCQVQAAVVVYGRGEAEPKVWPGVPEVTEILQRYRDLPGSLKEAHKLDNEIFARQRAKKMRRRVDSCKATARRLEVNLVLNDVSLGRRRDFDDLPRELAAAVMSVLNAFRSVTADRVNFLRSADAQEAAFSPPLEEAAALMALREPPMVPPVAMAAPVVANAPLMPPTPPQSALVVPLEEEEEPPMEPPMVADASLLLPAVEPESQATAAGMGADELLNLDAEPRNGSFLLEMADAIVDDGSGRQATAEDVDRLLREHGLESFKPM